MMGAERGYYSTDATAPSTIKIVHGPFSSVRFGSHELLEPEAEKKQPDPCHYCGKPSIKTTSLGKPICRRCLNPKPVENLGLRIGRNDACPCGSGRKFKKCCLEKLNGN